MSAGWRRSATRSGWKPHEAVSFRGWDAWVEPASMVMTADVVATLNFGSDEAPGIRRRGTKRFTYFNEMTGRPASQEDLLRIRSLAVPPAWQNVWISADPQSHLQATGRDARGRKQYRYHPAFVDSQAENKFSELVTFGNALGSLRGRVDRDLRRDDLDHDRGVATVVRLLDITSLRVGTTEYSRASESFGLTTLRNGHVVVRGSRIRMSFKGKSAHDFDVTVDSKRLGTIGAPGQALPGHQRFGTPPPGPAWSAAVRVPHGRRCAASRRFVGCQPLPRRPRRGGHHRQDVSNME